MLTAWSEGSQGSQPRGFVDGLLPSACERKTSPMGRLSGQEICRGCAAA